jgi:putative transposase
MPRGKKFTAEQIIGKLREAEVELARGKTVPEVVRKLGVTEQTYYRWKREYGGLRTDQAKRLKDLEKENARLKRLLADDEPQLVKRIVWMASEYGRYGYRRITALFRAEGWWVNYKRVERIWRQEGLKVPAKQPKRRRVWLGYGSCVRLRPTHRNHVWSHDFVMDRTTDGRAFRMLTIVDEFTRECLTIDVSRKLTSEDVLERLSDLFVSRGVPDHIRSDNGSEFTAKRVREWLERVGVKTLYIEPGSPWENGYVESFNGKLRDELLAREVFDTLLEAKVLIERWRKAYNTVRPHSSLGYRPPAQAAHRPCPLASATPQQADRGEPLAGQPW